MKVIPALVEGVLLFEPKVHRDEGGYFLVSWNRERYAEAGLEAAFVQDNLSFSQKGVLRGLHFQVAQRTQGKLVSVLEGEVFDVAVDLRAEFHTFGPVVWGLSFRREPAADVRARRLRTRVRGHQRYGAGLLQVHRRLLAGARAEPALERPGGRHRLAALRTYALGEGPRRPSPEQTGPRIDTVGAAVSRLS
jgi:hypothetical protein